MDAKKIIIILFISWIFLLAEGIVIRAGGEDQREIKLQEQQVLKWRKERDEFFKSHQRSPLTLQEKKNFKGLKYYPFDSK